MLRRLYLVLLTAALSTAGCATGIAQQPAHEPDVALVVLITVDQLRPDYFDRWDHQLAGGFALLSRTGATFTRAAHDHAITETAPGHATVGSGRYPVNTGIASNWAGVADPTVDLVGEPGGGASPHRFVGTSIADWLAAASPGARVVSISTKDRGAILPVGRVRGDVYWYAPSGRFTTSTYYRNALPRWVREFNDRRLPQSWAGRTWDLLLDESAYPEPDSVPYERGGNNFVFPHMLPADTAIAPRVLYVFPWIDELTLGLSLQAVRSLRLGAGGRTDLLAISLSGTDYIGHSFGPDSREIHDHILRLDRALGGFLDTLFTLVDQRRVVIALTSDHGVGPIPELRGAHRVPPAPFVTWMRAALAAGGADTLAFAFGSGTLELDRRALERSGMDAAALLRDFAAFAQTVPGVAAADLPAELARRDTTTDEIARRWLHMFEPDGDVDLVVTLGRYSIWSYGATATHGSPYDYDADAPLIFWGAPFRPGRYDFPARTVDLAPTLARVLGVRPLESVDGRVLTEALR